MPNIINKKPSLYISPTLTNKESFFGKGGINFSHIKLVIWDLDDTFWKGTLSEGAVDSISDNIQLVISLTNHGIINSICSKNDNKKTIEQLKKIGVRNYFVFPSIDWTPKGQRISHLIKAMGLRAENCLFIDDNPTNLNEALYYEKDLMVASPTIISKLKAYLDGMPAKDTTHKRLSQYRILERKQKAKASMSDNTSFLFNSETRVEILYDCLNHIDRIHELVSRTNQLNYTKKRSSKEELLAICQDTKTDTGYVKVRDKYGDYGIVGFYAVKDGNLLHFLFSCRTIGQGVEQYVFAKLNYPNLQTVGEVANPVDICSPAPPWINQINNINNNDNNSNKNHCRILLKGSCDMEAMAEYLESEQIVKEFNYVGQKKHNRIEHQNHSVNYLQFHFLPESTRKELIDECVFNDSEMYDTLLFDSNISIIFISTMIEPNLGIYHRKSDGLRIAFGEYLYPLTDSNNWDKFVNQELFTSGNYFTREWLESFSQKYEYEGRLNAQHIVENAKTLLSKIGEKTKICYILGSEMPYEKNTQKNYEGRHLIYKEINHLFRNLSKKEERILLIDVNEFIHSQDDFTNNINHFQRRVYYEMASKANEYIAAVTGDEIQRKNKIFLYQKMIKDSIISSGIIQTKMWSILRIPYQWIKSIIKI